MRSYTINQETLYRDGVAIAKVDGNDLAFLEGCKKYSGPAHKFFYEWQALGDECRDEKAPEIAWDESEIRNRFPDYKGKINWDQGVMTMDFVWWVHQHYPAQASVIYQNREIPW